MNIRSLRKQPTSREVATRALARIQVATSRNVGLFSQAEEYAAPLCELRTVVVFIISLAPASKKTKMLPRRRLITFALEC